MRIKSISDVMDMARDKHSNLLAMIIGAAGENICQAPTATGRDLGWVSASCTSQDSADTYLSARTGPHSGVSSCW